jgi:hypothetical protein
MLDNLLLLRESSKLSQVSFGELLPIIDEYAFVNLFFVLGIVGQFFCK